MKTTEKLNYETAQFPSSAFCRQHRFPLSTRGTGLHSQHRVPFYYRRWVEGSKEESHAVADGGGGTVEQTGEPTDQARWGARGQGTKWTVPSWPCCQHVETDPVVPHPSLYSVDSSESFFLPGPSANPDREK